MVEIEKEKINMYLCQFYMFNSRDEGNIFCKKMYRGLYAKNMIKDILKNSWQNRN